MGGLEMFDSKDPGVEQFLTRLHQEKLATQARRGSLGQRKLSWVAGLMALGVLDLPLDVGSRYVLYALPLVALVFDLYILGENYGIKRMGTFVRLRCASTPDGMWEEWLRGPSSSSSLNRRDRLARAALPIGTGVVTLGSLLLLYLDSAALGVSTFVWFSAILAILWFAYRASDRQLRRLDAMDSLDRAAARSRKEHDGRQDS